MAAMESMVFKARDAQQLARLKVGDKVTFRAGMVGTQPTIKDIKLAGR
jgi:Cu/Ag efflux protein CusF